MTWRHESRRHSLASRGIRSSGLSRPDPSSIENVVLRYENVALQLEQDVPYPKTANLRYRPSLIRKKVAERDTKRFQEAMETFSKEYEYRDKIQQRAFAKSGFYQTNPQGPVFSRNYPYKKATEKTLAKYPWFRKYILEVS